MRIKEITKPGNQRVKKTAQEKSTATNEATLPQLQMLVQQEYGDITDRLITANNLLSQIYDLLLARVKRKHGIRQMK